MSREGEQGIRITKRQKREDRQTRQRLCSMPMALMGLLTVTDNVPPSPAFHFGRAAEPKHMCTGRGEWLLGLVLMFSSGDH